MNDFTFLYMRHGRTHANEQGLCSGGECTTTLTPEGRARITQSARQLKDLGIIPQSVWLSPTVRTRETAAIVMEVLGLPPHVTREERLWRERHYGEWEGVEYIGLQDRFAAGEIGAGGETVEEFRLRIRSAVDHLAQAMLNDPPPGPLLLVAHGYVWQALHDIHEGPHVDEDVPWISNGDVYEMRLSASHLTSRKIAGHEDEKPGK
ncbi:MAG: hypothetical protein GC185_05055 [Alphaproteobacteria bacterium]|nr:hypothetical protein [Alphaproteobacteria bacterium]